MKRYFLTLLAAVLSLAFFAGCTARTAEGPCVGVADEKDPKLVYKLSGWNIAMGILFFELIAPPVVVAVDETFCPVAKK